MQVVLRQIYYQPDADFGFIYSTFGKGVYHGSAEPIQTPKQAWFQDFYKYLNELLPNATILIACPEDSPTTILGYSIVYNETLHFCYTKELFRKQGIATLMLKNQDLNSINYLNITKVGKAILLKYKGEQNE